MLRKPGALEQFHFTRAGLHLDSCVVCAAEYASETGTLTKDILFLALARTIETHAALGVRIITKSQNRCAFVRLEEIDLDKTVTFVSNKAISEVIQKELNLEFDTSSTGPLWRIVVLDEKTIVFSWHHIIGDGKSSFAFFRTLLRALNSPISSPSTNPSIVSIPSTLDLTPSVDTAAKAYTSPPLKTIAHEVPKLFISPSGWTGLPVGKKPKTDGILELVKLSSTELAQLLSACRANKATITSALYETAVVAVSDVIGKTKHKKICTGIAISLRELTGASPDVFAFDVSVAHHSPSISSEFSWSRAAQMAKELRGQRTVAAGQIGLLKFLFGNYVAYFEGMFGKKRQVGFGVSNLGVFKWEGEGGPWSVKDMWFGQSDTYTGAAFKVNVVGIANGGLSVTLTSGVEALEDGVLAKITERFVQIIHGLL